MTKHLLAISIGPVQDFIAASRRTADLYAGSQLLVNIAKTIANYIVENKHGTLIFPSKPKEDGPNKILAEITGGDPKSIAEACENVAVEYLRGNEKVPGVWSKVKGKIPKLDEPLANAQIESFLEFYAAWLPWDGDDATYDGVRRNLDRLLAGRKSLRDFKQPSTQAGRPKSPLDPSRDCALEVHGTDSVPFECRTDPLWLKARETLDALSLLKRVLGDKSTVHSTSYMAAEAILPLVRELALQDDQTELRTAINKLDELVRETPAGIDMGDLMFPNRLQEEVESLEEAQKKKNDTRRGEVLQLLKNPNIETWRKLILNVAKHLGHKGSECPPYYAILVADGDGMGALIGELKDIEKHRNFSKALSSFAKEAAAIVQKNSHGHLIYSGGDDVLALLPVNTVLQCAADLAKAFKKTLESDAYVKEAVDKMKNAGKKGGTLSVGIAVVHHMEPLLVSLEQARTTERAAKKEKPAMAIALHTRGGEPLTVVENWQERASIENWQSWVGAFRDELSRGFPYELRRLAREFSGTGLTAQALQAEAKRILKRKKGGIEDKTSESVATVESAIEGVKSPSDLEDLAKKLTIARFLATYPEVKS
ncbi:MAG: type III-B CRISPR-associated protein Cas10/Cmr2 [Bacteroidetes bacterium]|nr:type III-B CRISPR-associated protein Cas10/Cmr2 [Bacteroidota bacterium]MCW5897541.1 type III-B CRISPR-associated protein Cas10/Cmr2 [Bacteroidota bacterium]